MKQSFVGRNILAGLALLALSGCPSVNPSPYEPPPSTNSSGSNSSGSTSNNSGSPSNSGSSNSSGSSTSSLSRTGYSGLQTASEILQNPYVRANIQSLDNALARKYPEYADEETRIFLAKDNHLTPPIIEGDYTLMGRQLVPFEATLASGPYSLDNQTSNNFIDVAFDQSQIGQTTTGPSSTIIRGEGNGFTIYSVASVSQAPCSATVVQIWSGAKHPDGRITGTYSTTVTSVSGPCESMDSAGEFALLPK